MKRYGPETDESYDPGKPDPLPVAVLLAVAITASVFILAALIAASI